MNLDPITLSYILLVLIASVAIAFFQYFYQGKKQSRVTVILFTLRSLTLFLIGVLLINPQVKVLEMKSHKPLISLLIDNSKSMAFFKEEKKIKSIIKSIKENKDLNKKFELVSFSFGKDVQPLDSLNFDDRKTDINEAILSIDKLYPNKKRATILITDGNQTSGNDYEFYKAKNKIFPIIIGDTTYHQDIQISNLNVNKYSYLNNNFPVEAMVLYDGDSSITSNFTITHKGKKVISKKLYFSPNNKTNTINVELKSKEKGVQYYQASISSAIKEKNIKNNSRGFSVEVIDEQTKILLLSSIIHPDLGAIKKAIESNKQRKVEIKIIDKDVFNIENYQMFIFYQPNFSFKDVLKQVSSNYFLISGIKTDWRFINNLKLGIKKSTINQNETSAPIYKSDFLTFMQEDIGFDDFPPLMDKFGKIQFTRKNQALLGQNIEGIPSGQPLLVALEENEKKTMVLFGEGIWKWRSSSYLKEKSFEGFDKFLNNIVQYLTSNKKRNRLEITAKKSYFANEDIVFAAFYVDQNYRFDKRASLDLKIINSSTKKEISYPFSLMNNSYQVSIGGLDPGIYSYQVKVKGQSVTNRGSFKVADFEIEEQFVNANQNKLKKIASRTNGRVYYNNQVKALLNNLITDSNYSKIQESIISQKSLIEWKWYLILIVIFLASEWFIRKYFGRI